MSLFHSMRWRLQFWHGLLLALVLAGCGVTAYEYSKSAVLSSTDAELERRAGFFVQMLRQAPPPPGPALQAEGENGRRPAGDEVFGPPPARAGRPPEAAVLQRALREMPPGESAAYAADKADGWYYVLWFHNDRSPVRSANAPDGVTEPGTSEFRARGPNHRARGDLREAFVGLHPGDVVLVGHIMTEQLASLRRFAWMLTLGGVAILGLGLVVGRWLVERSLRPIEEISAAAAKIAGGNLAERIRTSDTDSELGRLAEILNDTFARLHASFEQQARFTADAAHELRTPVAILLTHTQNALNSTCAVPEHRESFAACQRAARRMRALIESLLQLARLDSGELEMRRVVFELSHRVSDCVDLVRPIAQARSIAVRLELSPVRSEGDPEQIDQVVTNLVTNAIHHNRDGGEVRVSTRAEGGKVVLTVADNGPGIAPEHLPHLFERFYRADKSRSRASGGVGLGLAISRAIVEAHGGTITVSSEPGKGAVFEVRLPTSVGDGA